MSSGSDASDDERNECNKLVDGTVVYVADNVLVMLMATSAGTLGQTIFSKTGLSPVVLNCLGVLFNLGLAILCYLFAANRFHAAEAKQEQDASDDLVAEGRLSLMTSDSEILKRLGSSKAVEVVQHNLTMIVGDATSGYSHMLGMLPWIIIVPVVNIPPVLSTAIYSYFDEDPNLQTIAVWHFFMFMAYLLVEVFLARWYASLPDSGAKCESLPTFILNAVNHGFLSSTGKSLHLLEVVIYEGLVGTKNVNKFEIHAKAMESLVLLLATWFLLVHVWPRLREDDTRDKLLKSMVTTITVYSWAFSFVNNLWNLFYYLIPNGQLWYWVLMVVFVLFAVVLAKFSDLNFYGGPSRAGAGFGLMLCWAIDFGVWWAWAQVMADIDAAAVPNGTVLPMILVNGAVLAGLMTVTCLVYIFGDLHSMAVAKHHRHKHIHTAQNAMGSLRSEKKGSSRSEEEL